MLILPGLLCGGVAIAAVLLLGSVLLQAGISLANKCLGTSSNKQFDPDEDELDEWIGYRQIRYPSKGVSGVGIGKGMVCFFVLTLVDVLAGIPIRLIYEVGAYGRFLDDGSLIFAHLLGLIICFPLAAWILSSLLRTNFGRACVVLLMIYLIILGLIGSLFFLLAILRSVF